MMKMQQEFTTRRLILVDIENLCGTGRLIGDMIVYVQEILARMLMLSHRDQLVIATDKGNGAAVGFAWQGQRVLRLAEGKDGADLQLLDVLSDTRYLSQFDEIVVASGDGIFAEPLLELSRQGFTVTVVSYVEQMALKLRYCASRVLNISDHLVASVAA